MLYGAFHLPVYSCVNVYQGLFKASRKYDDNIGALEQLQITHSSVKIINDWVQWLQCILDF